MKFTDYQFPAIGAPTARTMPVRLNDIINVKDWGAKGDGVTDDTAAINAAISYTWTLGDQLHGVMGAFVFFPPGIYRIGTPPLFLDRSPWPDGITTLARISYLGSGRDVTILKGNYGNGNGQEWFSSSFLVICGQAVNVGPPWPPTKPGATTTFNYGGLVHCIRDLTIWNDSVVPKSGALQVASSGNNLQLINSHFHGFNGVNHSSNVFVASTRNCRFTCSVPKTAADAATRAPLYLDSKFPQPPGTDAPTVNPDSPLNAGNWQGSVGLAINSSPVFNCTFDGFDVGLAFVGNGPCYGNHFYRCGIGVGLSLLSGSPIGVCDNNCIQSQSGRWYSTFGGSLCANWFERCQIGTLQYATSIFETSANRFSGLDGPCDPVPISSIVTNGTTATVTTASNHNLPQPRPISAISYDGSSRATVTSTNHGLPAGVTRLRLVVSPATLTPDGSGNQIVPVTWVDANTFWYALIGTPGTFASATWNDPVTLFLRTSPQMWTPDGSGYQAVPVTVTGVNQFSYPLTGTPSAFVSGSWNYVSDYGIVVPGAENCVYAANTVEMATGKAGFSIGYTTTPGITTGVPPTEEFEVENNLVMAMSGLTWAPPVWRIQGKTSYRFIQCGDAVSSPNAWTQFYGSHPSGGAEANQPGPYYGQTFTIVDCDSQPSFGGTVTNTGGTNVYKVRYDSTNWIRIA